MVKNGLAFYPFLALALLLAACGPSGGATPVATPSRNESKAPAANEPTGNWDRTVAAAKQEGTVTIYTSAGPGQTGALRQGFLQAFGISAEFVAGRGAELREKLFRERSAGLYLVDIYLMGASGMILDLKPVGALDPLKPKLALPEVVDPKLWFGGSHIYQDKERMYVIGFSFFPEAPVVVNSEQVKPEDIKSWDDLLHPRWKGKIVINDPTTTGSGQKMFQMASKLKGFGFFQELAKQEPVVIRDLRQQTEWVARGKYAVLLGPQRSAVAELMNAGAPLKYLSPSDGGYAGAGTGNMSLINKPAHPNAAKVFTNWLLSKEGATIYSKNFLIQSARLDVPTDHLDPQMVRQPGAVYSNSDDEEIALERDAVVKEASTILGPLIR